MHCKSTFFMPFFFALFITKFLDSAAQAFSLAGVTVHFSPIYKKPGVRNYIFSACKKRINNGLKRTISEITNRC